MNLIGLGQKTASFGELVLHPPDFPSLYEHKLRAYGTMQRSECNRASNNCLLYLAVSRDTPVPIPFIRIVGRATTRWLCGRPQKPLAECRWVAQSGEATRSG